MARIDQKPLLNTLRWTSAFLVMFGHSFGWVFDVDSSALGVGKYILDLGHPAVIVFFVVSGYLIGGNIISDVKFSWLNYSVARFSRIYLVVIPALILSVFLDGVVFFGFGSNPIYSATWGRITDPVFASYGWSNIIASVLSLESILGPPIGSNKPLWSLGYEWAFYFIFPVIFGLVRKTPLWGRRYIALGAVLLVPAGLMVLTGQRWMSIYWFIWWAGAISSTIQTPRGLSILFGCIALGVFIASPFLDQKIAAPIEGMALAGFLSCPSNLGKFLNRDVDRSLADMSFSLYLIHMPVMTFVVFIAWSSGWFPLERFQQFRAGIMLWVFVCSLSIGVAWLFWRFFESQTGRVRGMILGRLSR